MIPKPIDIITEADILALVSGGVSERRTIEYKAALPGGADGERKEFLYDVSSFANAAGGDLLFGVPEVKDENGKNTGTPASPIGVALSTTLDAEVQRLTSMIRDGIRPHLQGVEVRAIGNFRDGPVILIRIPRSWNGPHMVVFKDACRFYARGAVGKLLLSVDEVRDAFLATASLPERLDRVRRDRVSRILAEQTPLPMTQLSKAVLHVVPLAALSGHSRIDGAALADAMRGLPTMGGSGWNHRMNFDGFLNYTTRQSDGTCVSYVQAFRSGLVELVRHEFLSLRDGGQTIASIAYERELIDATHDTMRALGRAQQSPPYFACITLLGVKGARMPRGGHPVDRDVLFLPDVQLDDAGPNKQEIARALRPAFDVVWQSAGCARSFNYGEDGSWTEKNR
jgi:hypothetical protein